MKVTNFFYLLADNGKPRTGNSDGPAVLRRNSLESFDFGSEANTPVAVRLIAHVYDSRGAAHLLGGIPGYFRGHAQGRFDGHSHLQRSRRSEKEATTRDVQGFRKVLSFVRSYAQGAETKRRPKVEAGKLPTFGYFHFVLPRARKIWRGLLRISWRVLPA